jgi:hypothetical protein
MVPKKSKPSQLESQYWQFPSKIPRTILLGTKEDLVNPQHYQGAGMQVIDVLKAFLSAEEFKGYLKGNILKYQLRCEKKGKATDLDKAHWYQEELKKILNGSHST